MKVIDKLSALTSNNQVSVSLEIFPPKTDAGVFNLYSRLEKMQDLDADFISVTWGAMQSEAGLSIEICSTLQEYYNYHSTLHLTCSQYTELELHDILSRATEHGIENILALRGDSPPQTDSHFKYAKDLIKFIKKNYSDKFCIGVAAYPEGHQDNPTPAKEYDYLKEKFDCGADFAISQLFYDVNCYESFMEQCSIRQINNPILAGILPIHNYERFIKITEVLSLKIPEDLIARLELIRDDDEAVLDLGIKTSTEHCQQLLKLGVPGLHFYTLNLETATREVLNSLNLKRGMVDKVKTLPWVQANSKSRVNENVRPIFWNNRTKSYLARTKQWDDFPNGRWGDARSPTYGALENYYSLRTGLKSKKILQKKQKIWGNPVSHADLMDVFVGFCKGKVKELPWSESSLNLESGLISEDLIALNSKGYLTINSQPQINGISSADSNVGWGSSDGLIYQKAYIEFFIPPEKLNPLLNKLAKRPSLSFQIASSVKTDEIMSNFEENSVNAVTWGVFPNKEIIQPTIVDRQNFIIWKEEAFSLWLNEWQVVYEEASQSWEFLQKVFDTYYLVNIVENDYVNGDLYSLFE